MYFILYVLLLSLSMYVCVSLYVFLYVSVPGMSVSFCIYQSVCNFLCLFSVFHLCNLYLRLSRPMYVSVCITVG